MLDKLHNIGFREFGQWILCPNGEIEPRFLADATSKNILYAFVANSEVLYIGKTVRSLKKRMYGYQNPGTTQTTNIKNNANIKSVLTTGSTVSIFALPDHGLLSYGIFHLNLAAGLEDSLVAKIKPKWNKTGA